MVEAAGAGVRVDALALSASATALLREIVELAADAPPGPATMRHLLDDLQQLIGCDSAAGYTLDVPARRQRYNQQVMSGEHVLALPKELEEQAADAAQRRFFELYWSSSCSRSEWPGVPNVMALSEFSTPQQWQNDPMREVLEVDGEGPIIDDLVVAYPEGAGRSRRLLFVRERGRRFGERELLLMKLLLPHLDRPLAAAAKSSSPATPALTRRQREILNLVRVGMANKQIAGTLGISEGTVRKHLENIFARLGVQSRTAAATVAVNTREG